MWRVERAQILIEFALTLVLILFIILEGIQLSLIDRATARLEHAVIEGAVAGASEPAPPRRCDVAESVVNSVLSRPIESFRCTGIGDRIELTVERRLTTISPFHADPIVIHVVESAQVRK